jgi:putative chitinase
MVADGESDTGLDSTSDLITKTLAVLRRVAPRAHPNYLQAIREGGPLFEQHGITTTLRMAHFLAQAMQETGRFTVLRESMNYKVPQMLKIFGVGKHSARVTAAEAPGLAHNERALAERVYGLGNPRKFPELGNTEPGDGFRYRGNGILQTTGRGAHRRMGLACGLDFEGNPDLVTFPEHALKPALQEWSDGNLNVAADRNDIRTITLKINGGLNGFEERQEFFAQILPLLRSS